MSQSPSFESLIQSGKRDLANQCFKDFDWSDFNDPSIDNLNFTYSEFEQGLFEKGQFVQLNLRGSEFKNITFKDISFKNCGGSNYYFENCCFEGCRFEQGDWAVGNFYESQFKECIFDSTDFALCYHIDTVFDQCKFMFCNLNASQFEKGKWIKPHFEGTQFKYIEGMSKEEMDQLKACGADICRPVEVEFQEALKAFWQKSLTAWMRYLLIGSLFFVAGYHHKKIKRLFSDFITMDSNPLSDVYELTKRMKSRKSFFQSRMYLPNHDFSQTGDHWLFTQPNDKEYSWNHQNFNTFPRSLDFHDYKGKMYYSTTGSSENQSDVLQNPSIWMNVHPRGEKLKLSFYYQKGHGQFKVIGRLINGGYQTLASVEPIQKPKDPHWNYFSEGIYVSSKFDAVCIEISKLNSIMLLDDVNLEATI